MNFNNKNYYANIVRIKLYSLICVKKLVSTVKH